MTQTNNKVLVGALEKCNLPSLGIFNMHIRVDTGAATSSLHVDNLKEFRKEGEKWVSFDIHPDVHDVKSIVSREARVITKKKVKSSTATREKRVVISTQIEIAGQQWDIELTLTDRSEMSYLMLLGREAMSGRLIVDPEHEFIVS